MYSMKFWGHVPPLGPSHGPLMTKQLSKFSGNCSVQYYVPHSSTSGWPYLRLPTSAVYYLVFILYSVARVYGIIIASSSIRPQWHILLLTGTHRILRVFEYIITYRTEPRLLYLRILLLHYMWSSGIHHRNVAEAFIK